MDKVFVTFELNIRNTRYSYEASKSGTASVEFEGNAAILEHLDMGTLLDELLKSALVEYAAEDESLQDDPDAAGVEL